MKKHISIDNIFESQMVSNLIEAGGEVYAVGGCVRDLHTFTTPKDIDLMVRLLSVEKLMEVLNETGSVELVGESFGVFVYTDNSGFTVEVSLPRRDSKGEGKGHTAIEVQTDPNLPVEVDLKRRDFTCNAMALDINRKLIDPFGGAEDIKDKIIKAVDVVAFVDDPLRILRAIRFSVQLGFSISSETFKLVSKNIEELSHIAPERKLAELNKIVSSGVRTFELGVLLKQTNSTKQIFGVEFSNFNKSSVQIKFLAEILHLIPVENKVNFFQTSLKIDTDTANKLRAFEKLEEITDTTQESEAAQIVFDALQYAKNDEILQSDLLQVQGAEGFKRGHFPTHKHKIALKGGRLFQLGFKGKEIDEVHTVLLTKLFEGKIDNTEKSMEEFVVNNFKKIKS